jgi:hypothetical protein
MTRTIEDLLAVSMREEVAGLTPAPDLVARAARRHRQYTRVRRAASVTGTAGIAAAAAVAAITASNAPAAAPSHPAASHAQTGQAARRAVLAAQVMGTAAAHVAGEGVASEPSPGQWIYSKTVDYGYKGIVGPSGVGTDQEWITFDGIHSAYYGNGQLVQHTSPIPSLGAVKPWIAWNTWPTPKTAYDVLASLPTSPQALLKVIAGHAVGQNSAAGPFPGVAPGNEAQREFDYLTQILWNAAGGVGGPPAAEAAAYRAMATLPGITVQQGIKDLAGGQAIGVSDDGGYDQFLIDPVSYQVIGLRQLSTGIGPMTLGQEIAAGKIPPRLRKILAHPTKAERARIARAMKQRPVAYPPKGTLIWESVHVQITEVRAPGDR